MLVESRECAACPAVARHRQLEPWFW